MLKLYPLKLVYFERGSVKVTSGEYKFGSIPTSSNKCDRSSVKSFFSFESVSPVKPLSLVSSFSRAAVSPSTSTSVVFDDARLARFLHLLPLLLSVSARVRRRVGAKKDDEHEEELDAEKDERILYRVDMLRVQITCEINGNI